MPQTNNVAGRLYAVLEDARSRSAKGSARAAWAEILDCEPRSRDVVRRLLTLGDLVEETLSELSDLEGFSLEIYQPKIESIRAVVDPIHLNDSWPSVVAKLDDSAMMALAAGSDWIGRFGTVGEIPAEKLANLQREITALQERVLSIEEESPLRTFLVRHLQLMNGAIVEYRLRGPEALEEALERAVGGMAVGAPPFKEEELENERRAFESLVARLHSVVALAIKVRELAEPVIKMLPGSF